MSGNVREDQRERVQEKKSMSGSKRFLSFQTKCGSGCDAGHIEKVCKALSMTIIYMWVIYAKESRLIKNKILIHHIFSVRFKSDTGMNLDHALI